MGISARLSSFLCIFLFINSSDSACEADGKTYNVGETWQELANDPDCFLHTCLPDGTYTTDKCDPAHNDVEVPVTLVETKVIEADTNDNGATETVIDDVTETITTTEVTTVNEENVSGCTVDGQEVAVGQQVDVPGRCLYRACAGQEQWLMKACPLIGLTPGWILTPEDASKPYPDCCSRAAPLLGIIPDVVQGLQWSVTLKLAYSNATVDYGNELTPWQVRTQPSVSYTADPDSWFLLSMVDPDTATPQFLHWQVGNIPGADVDSGEVLAEYVGSGPPNGTGLHRYTFLLHRQPGNITFDQPSLDNTSVQGRRNFSVTQFAQKYNLSDPVALNFFVAQYDDYVPEVHRQLGILV